MDKKRKWAILLSICLLLTGVPVMASEVTTDVPADVKLSIEVQVDGNDVAEVESGDEITVIVNMDKFSSTLKNDNSKLLTTIQFFIPYDGNIFEYVEGSMQNGCIYTVNALTGEFVDVNVHDNMVKVAAVYKDVTAGALEESDSTQKLLAFRLRVKDTINETQYTAFDFTDVYLKNLYIEEEYSFNVDLPMLTVKVAEDEEVASTEETATETSEEENTESISTEEPGEDNTEGATTEEPGEENTEGAITEEPEKENTESTSTEESGEENTESASTEEPKEENTESASTEEPGEENTESTSTEEPREENTENTSTEEPGKESTESASTEESGEENTESISTEELGKENTESTSTEEPEKENTESTSTEEPEEESTESISTEEPRKESTESASTENTDAEGTTSTQTEISKPTGIKAVATGYNKIKISWDKVSEATGYDVYRYDTKKKQYIRVETVRTNSIVQTKLNTGTQYRYKVCAYIEQNGQIIYGPLSDVVSAKPKLGTTTIKLKRNKNGTVTLSWKKTKGASGYIVYRSTSKKGKYKSVKTLRKNKYVNTGLKTGKKYYYKVVPYRIVKGKRVKGLSSAVKSVKIQ